MTEQKDPMIFIEARKKFLAEQNEISTKTREMAKKRRTLDVEATLDRIEQVARLPKGFNRKTASFEYKHIMAIKCCIANKLDCITMAGTDVNPNPPSGKVPIFL